MPIRMVKDSDGGSRKSDNYPGKRQRVSTGLGGNNMLSLLLSFLFKKPKIGIPILIIGAIIYFFFLRDSNTPLSPIASSLGLGCEMSEEVYDQAEVFEPLADNTKNPLPESVSLLEYCPQRLNQGEQGSCVGWASSYAARTILQSQATGQNPDHVRFSPSYLYNQIALSGCNGTYIIKAMEKMQAEGVLPYSKFSYTDQNCSKQPNRDEKIQASEFRIKGFNRLSYDGDNYKTDLLAIKQNLAQKAPVVIGMMVGGSFMQEMMGQKVWFPNRSDYDLRGFSGHAMCIIGYDDYLEGGAFQIMNSWGNEWGENGIAWVRYKDFDYFGKEAYGLYPMGKDDPQLENKLNIEFGLVENETGKNIPLRRKQGNVFITKNPIRTGTKFKVEINNTIECYSYILGQETDGSSYVLFPYTKKHSPYCGITGTRLFPKDYSMMADDIGNKDFVVVLFTKQPIDYVKLNEAINQNNQQDYAFKVFNTIGNELADNILYRESDNITFESDLGNKTIVAIMLEIDKL